MSESCSILNCSSISIGTCFCCNQSVCRDHFIEHDYLIGLEVNNLNEKMNKLDKKLENFNLNKITKDFYIKLNQWRMDSYHMIDQFYDKKCQELYHYINRLLNKHEKKLNNLKQNISEMVHLQQTTNQHLNLLTLNIKNLEEKLNQIEYLSIKMNTNPLILNDNLIDLEISNPYEIDLTNSYQIIDRKPLSSDAMTSNQQYLLFHQHSNLYLIDKNLFVIKEKKWPYDWIRDMSWSQTLNSFIIITSNNIYLVEQNSFEIQHIQTIEGKFWQSCTCSDTYLYLSKDTWNSSIEQYSLKPSIQFIKQYKTTEINNEKQRIDSIKYNQNNQTILLVINNQTNKQISIELRSIKNFDRFWSFKLPIEYSERKIQSCLFKLNTLMIVDWETSTIFHLTNNGNLNQIINYNSQVQYLHLFQTNIFAVSTNQKFYFHKL